MDMHKSMPPDTAKIQKETSEAQHHLNEKWEILLKVDVLQNYIRMHPDQNASIKTKFKK